VTVNQQAWLLLFLPTLALSLVAWAYAVFIRARDRARLDRQLQERERVLEANRRLDERLHRFVHMGNRLGPWPGCDACQAEHDAQQPAPVRDGRYR
jgi:hypothetical protein